MSIVMFACSGVSAQDAPAAVRPVLRTVYFIPTDRQPEPDFRARLDRVMTEVQRFYRDGMERNGYGGMGFELDRDDAGALRIFEVNAKGPMRDYGRNDSGKVRREVKDALARQGLDIDREVIVIFQLLLVWQDGKAEEVGPYVGAGGASYGHGTAWVYDDAKLDAALLASKDPGGYYHGPCSLGQFNTHYIGGIAHELGHAFGLPHDCQSEADLAARGSSLMGNGNHTYGMNLRGQGNGTFLSAASALPLSVHPLFTGRTAQGPPPVSCRLAKLKAAFADGAILLDGQMEGGGLPTGIVALNNLTDKPGDYHAVGWACPVGADGRFALALGELTPGNWHLRLRAYGPRGDFQSFEFRYAVNPQGTPDLTPFAEAIWLQRALDAFKAKDRDALKDIRAEAQGARDANAQTLAKLTHLDKLLADTRPPPALAGVTADTILLGDVAYESATVGWGGALRNQVLAGEGGPLLEVGGAFFASGLYAHAPARHVYGLDGKWKTFDTKFGLQDGNGGTVVFVVKGDGKELFRSETIRGGAAREQKISVSGVRQLELIVEDAGDGNGSDWGVWLEPRLSR